MKNLKTTIALSASLLVLSLAAVQPAAAQDDEKNLRMVSLIQLEPAQAKNWNEGWEDVIKMAAEENYPHSEFVGEYRNNRIIITSLANFAEMDAVIASRTAVGKAQGEKFAEALAKMDAAEIGTRTFFSRFDPELSYLPEGDEPESFAEIETYYYKPGKQDEMKEVIADFKALSAAVNSPDGWFVYWNGVGSPGNSVTIVSTAENALDMAQENAANEKLFESKEKEFEKLFGRFIAISLNSETQHMNYRPEWSMNQ